MGNDTEDANIHYRVLASGELNGDSLGKLISAEGPTGIAIKNPSKEAIATTYYTFTGYWTTDIEPTEDSIRYYVDGLENPDNKAINFNNLVPVDDMVFYPEFLASVRTYEVKFHDYDGNVIEAYDVPYGLTYKAAGGTLTNYFR